MERYCTSRRAPSPPRASLPDLLAFIGNSTFAAITAVVAANVVLVAYIISSVRDDKVEREAAKPLESRKDR
jgi:vacuolar ATPase assembly integral membrane protein VMA21